MVALLFMLCFLLIVALVTVVLGVAGVAMAIVTVVALVNISVVTLGAMYGRRRQPPEIWQPETLPPEAGTQREHIVADEQGAPIDTIPHFH
jgi:hypothetical protein